jgi:hypothetical protein
MAMNRGSLVVVALAFACTPGLAEDAALTYTRTTLHSRAECYAGSTIADPEALGGFGDSKNFPRPVPADPAREGTLYLEALPEETAGEGRLVLRLVNRTGAVVWFDASDSRLSIVQEAQDLLGTWRPVEYLPSSFCGNSYHRVGLGTGEAWTFNPRRYEGELRTRLRFRLKRDDADDLLSNEFVGSVNAGQFDPERKEGHRRANVMDPYDD